MITKVISKIKGFFFEKETDIREIVGVCGVDVTNPRDVRDFISAAYAKMSQHPDVLFGDQPEMCPLEHSFAPGIYVRQITIPKGMLIVGKIHKHRHPNFLLKGKVSVLTETAGVQVIEGPCSMISEPGTRRLLYTHKETVWTTVHHNPDEIRNLEQLENHIIAKSYDELESVIMEVES